VISGSPTDVRPVLKAVAERAARICEADDSRILLREGDDLQVTMGDQFLKGPAEGFTHPIERGWVAGRAFIDRVPVHVADLSSDEAAREFPAGTKIAREFGVRTTLAVPLLREDAALGVILLRRSTVKPFDPNQISLLETFADQAAIAIENVRLFNETREALEQQQASGEVLSAISSSIADTGPVFERILASCERLFEGKVGVINLIREDGRVHLAAYHGPGREKLEQIYPFPLDENSATGRVVLRRQLIHFSDIEHDPEVPPLARVGWEAMGVRAVIGAPMLWEGSGIGSIIVCRDFPGPFSEKEIALLRTFADQAAIAIQNARLFREIQDKSRQLEIANKHKSEFLANMSHELRTPLNAIIGFSEVLIERMFGEVNDKQDEYLRDIHSSGRHLLQLINDILDLSKVEAGRMELEASRFRVPDSIDNAMTLIRERAQRHGIALGKDIDPAVDEVVADERKFKQILLNLLSNAVKFTPDGGRVDVIARRTPDALEVAVRDTGIGIAADDQKLVFEEFRQVGNDYTNKQEGTGLGLALARRFVGLHGGTIAVESEPGRGSTFTFTIPWRDAPSPERHA
jgi:signal transduction histidine kinase